MARPANPLWLARFDAGFRPAARSRNRLFEWLSLGMELESARHSDRRTGVRRSCERSRSPDASRRRPTFRPSSATSLARDEAVWLAPNTRLERLARRSLWRDPCYRSPCLSAARERAGAPPERRPSRRREPRQRSRPGGAGRKPAIAEAVEPILERRAEPVVRHAAQAPLVSHRAYLPGR